MCHLLINLPLVLVSLGLSCSNYSSASTYDNLLKNYCRLLEYDNSELVEYRKSKGVNYKGGWLYQNQSILRSEWSDFEPMYGIFFVGNDIRPDELNVLSSLMPSVQYSMSLSADEKKELKTHILEKHATNLDYVNSLELAILDLHGANITSSELSHLKLLVNLKVLGLPNHGVSFTDEIEFPENLEVLVVRNSILNRSFFRHLKKNNKLRHLILKDCRLDSHDYVISYESEEFIYAAPVSPNSLYAELSSRLKSLTIVSCSRSTVTNLATVSWSSLESLEIVENKSDFRILVEYLGGRIDQNSTETLRDSSRFPALKSLILEGKL